MGKILADIARRDRANAGRPKLVVCQTDKGALHLNRVGMRCREITVFPMSIFENVAFGTRLHEQLGRAELAMHVQEALTRVAVWTEVKDRCHSLATDLSGGQQKRLCTAWALSTGPEMLLTGEPISALGPLGMMKVKGPVDELTLDMTLVLVTPNLQQAARYADQTAFFYLGRMIEWGSAGHMFLAPTLPQTRDRVTGRFG